MRNYKTLNNIFGWLAFIIAAFTYLSTIEPTASLWDCSEFITSGFKLEVGHPPGAPLFIMIMRIFMLFAPSVEYAAMLANSLSAIMSALTILFLFWSISHLARKLISKPTEEYSTSQYIAVFGSAMVGALAYTFSDTFWFSAVEGEVYATSSFITALVFWAILKWEECADERYANRWLILLAYITGLSIGVHLLNLLAVPAIVFVYYFRKYNISKQGIIKVSILSIVLLSLLIWVLIPGIPQMASWFELPFVNDMKFPINSGLLCYIIVLISLLISGIGYTLSQKKEYYIAALASIALITIMLLWSVVSSYIPWYSIIIWGLVIGALKITFSYFINRNGMAVLNTILLAATMLVIGYGSYAMIIIRSSANPPMDQNNPDNIFALISYLNRDQYGNEPRLYGQYYNAPVTKIDDTFSYVRVGNRYEKAGYKPQYTFDPRYTTIFPRMYSSDKDKVEVYKSYVKGRSISGTNGEENIIPKFSENMAFMFDYQLGFMYWRYFMWNFAGRQNDIQATKGDPTRGNWISGIKFIDEARLGKQENKPEVLMNNKGHNVYYMLPLLLGLIGLVYQLIRDKRNYVIVALLFFLTGIAIVLYLNQTPNQVRERDYAYAGSFYAFSIWIGLGVMALYKMFKHVTHPTVAAGIVTAASLGVPVIMCNQNWDDHDRSGRYLASDFGYNYLNSCDPGGIVFVYADNDTFPLWYSQGVEEVRTDVRVANSMYLNADWYYTQMMRKVYTSDRFATTATPAKIAGNRRDQIPVFESIKAPIDANATMNFVMSDDDDKKTTINQTLMGESIINYFPSKTLAKPIDKEKFIANGLVPITDTAFVSPALFMSLPSMVNKSSLALIDIISNNFPKRPIYFGISLPSEYQMGLGNNIQLEGLAYKLVPFNTSQINKSVNIEKTYDLLMNKFRYRGINNPNVYMDETARRHIGFYRRAFFDLGNALDVNGQTELLKKLLAKFEEVLPTNTTPLYYANPIVKLYLAAGEVEKATELTHKLCKEYSAEIDFYLNLFKQGFDMTPDISTSLTGLSNLNKLIKYQQNAELEKIVGETLKKYSSFMAPE